MISVESHLRDLAEDLARPGRCSGVYRPASRPPAPVPRTWTSPRSSTGASSDRSAMKNSPLERRQRPAPAATTSMRRRKAASETAAVAALEAVKPRSIVVKMRPGFGLCLRSFEHIIGVSVRAHETRDQHRAGERQREFQEQPAGAARREGDRRIDRGQRQRHGDDGEADLSRALDGGGESASCPPRCAGRCSPARRWRRRRRGRWPAPWRAASAC